MQRVLLADNSKSVLVTLSRMLGTRPGVEVVCCLSLADAVRAAEEEGPFLAGIFGTVLPDATGEEIVETAVRHLPTIVFTSRLDAATQQAMWSRGIVDYVAKESMESFEHVVALLDRLASNPQRGVIVAHRDTLYRGALLDLLQRHNYLVRQAGNGEAVIDALQAAPAPRLLLLDSELEGPGTTRLMNRIRKVRPKEELAVVVLADPENPFATARLIKFGASGSLQHGFSPEEFFSRVALNLEMIETLSRLRDSAIRDALTGLYNRRHFLESAHREFARQTRKADPLALIMFDADHFKSVNDSYGHKAGDMVLQKVGEILTKTFRTTDLAARYGGEEFVVLLPHTSEEAAWKLAERVRENIESCEFSFEDQQFAVTASIGVASVEGGALTSDDDLIIKADKALYQAKNNGRNMVVVSGRHSQPAVQ